MNTGHNSKVLVKIPSELRGLRTTKALLVRLLPLFPSVQRSRRPSAKPPVKGGLVDLCTEGGSETNHKAFARLFVSDAPALHFHPLQTMGIQVKKFG